MAGTGPGAEVSAWACSAVWPRVIFTQPPSREAGAVCLRVHGCHVAPDPMSESTCVRGGGSLFSISQRDWNIRAAGVSCTP